jgi:hypothetical protein
LEQPSGFQHHDAAGGVIGRPGGNVPRIQVGA